MPQHGKRALAKPRAEGTGHQRTISARCSARRSVAPLAGWAR
jgi:hypothetical protein